MNKEIEKVLKSWESSLERYGKLDNWKRQEDLSILGKYLRVKEDSNSIRELVREIRDKAICPVSEYTSLLALIKKVLEKTEAPKEEICLMVKRGSRRIKKEGQEFRFRGQTKKIFEEKLKFKGGMLLRNFDIETETAVESRKVRRIVEKRMCQAYHRMNKKSSTEEKDNSDRYWESRATSFQLYNIGQVENVRGKSRGDSTHWKRMYDPLTGNVVFKKKMAYPSREAAEEALRFWEISHPEDRRKMHAYQCSVCHKWHIGHYSEKKDIPVASFSQTSSLLQCCSN
jgi:hypothetical protein